jgi:Prolyl oligopeptidase family
MKKLFFALTILLAQTLHAQSYDEQMNKAGEALQKKEFCAALTIFQTAFKDSTKVGTYDLAFAAVAAANCNAEKLALNWLKISQLKGLGMNPGEADGVANDPSFEKLRSFKEWAEFVAAMKQAVVEKQLMDKKKSEDWLKTINANQISIKSKKKFNKANSGFALYFTQVDSLKVPYLVSIPKNYNPKKPTKTVVYLHGGIVNADRFNYENPELATGEPIFSIGENFNAIVIYPVGKKDFGWVNQKAAFENVLTVIKNVQQAYNIDSENIVLGGMSNGGTATFWFASQNANIFKGFYTFSALPKLEIGDINFTNLAQGKPFYSTQAKDDDVFKFDDVNAIYSAQKAIAKDWQMEVLESGGHGYIYQQNGKELINAVFKKLFPQ